MTTPSSSANDIPAKKTKLEDNLDRAITWDDHFMSLAVLSSKRSRDPRVQVGAVIVNEDNRIIGIGYNGFPKGCSDEKFPWYRYEDVDYCHQVDPIHSKDHFVVHAEANAILNKNCANLKNTRLYTTLFPCTNCAHLIVQSGITNIYYLSDKMGKKYSPDKSKRLFSAAKIDTHRIFIKQNIVIDFDEYLKNN
ncbi:probable deoxycytidylate deaminase [Lucilia sericata]|uniref:probable deoxycytidylate deaminase n=1 Tax=Lucilia sericata TaxID=13632 RepID=UPI0018A88291|nr:probable deoxycytidylate deaminase [Lucilia sericata]XP_037820515.1 probable deoxycytidylate deaminase [Lucilia sericata]